MKSARTPGAVIVVPDDVVRTLSTLTESLTVDDVVLVGGWSVACRLRMSHATARPTEDVDAMLSTFGQPTAAALQRAGLVQDDPAHSCRLSGPGLTVDVDLLADASEGSVVTIGTTDADGTSSELTLLVPPFGSLLARTAVRVALESADTGERVSLGLPLAGALFAAKLGNLALEDRHPEKRATDGEDLVRLAHAFGGVALLDDLDAITTAEAERLSSLLAAVGASGISAQARVAGFVHDDERVHLVVARLESGLHQLGEGNDA